MMTFEDATKPSMRLSQAWVQLLLRDHERLPVAARGLFWDLPFYTDTDGRQLTLILAAHDTAWDKLPADTVEAFELAISCEVGRMVSLKLSTYEELWKECSRSLPEV